MQDGIEAILKAGAKDVEHWKWFLERSFWQLFARRTIAVGTLTESEKQPEAQPPAPWDVIKSILVKALERHPEAREEVVAALEAMSQ